jgi:hypothetical protein
MQCLLQSACVIGSAVLVNVRWCAPSGRVFQRVGGMDGCAAAGHCNAVLCGGSSEAMGAGTWPSAAAAAVMCWVCKVLWDWVA